MFASITLKTKAPLASTWRYLWAKRVIGFNPEVHCARCLLGPYLPEISLRMTTAKKVNLVYPNGTVLYLCGVAAPYKWVNNLHVPFVIQSDAPGFTVKAYNGDSIILTGATPLSIDASIAQSKYSDKDKSFLTCRNFQFGAAHFEPSA